MLQFDKIIFRIVLSAHFDLIDAHKMQIQPRFAPTKKGMLHFLILFSGLAVRVFQNLSFQNADAARLKQNCESRPPTDQNVQRTSGSPSRWHLAVCCPPQSAKESFQQQRFTESGTNFNPEKSDTLKSKVVTRVLGERWRNVWVLCSPSVFIFIRPC